MLEHTLPKGSSDFRVGTSLQPFFLSSLSKTFLAEALDPDKRITADDDWHLEQCKAKQEKKSGDWDWRWWCRSKNRAPPKITCIIRLLFACHHMSLTTTKVNSVNSPCFLFVRRTVSRRPWDIILWRIPKPWRLQASADHHAPRTTAVSPIKTFWPRGTFWDSRL